MFIIVDTQRTRLKRSKLINKILCTISVFDFVGSFAMAFASLPTPEEDYVYGAKVRSNLISKLLIQLLMTTSKIFSATLIG